MKTEAKIVGIVLTEQDVPKVMSGAKAQMRLIESGLRALNDCEAKGWILDENNDSVFSFCSGNTAQTVSPRYQIGDRLYVKEALEQYNVHKSRPVFAVYKTDKAHVWTPNRDFRRWQSDDGEPWKSEVIPARCMPRSAARTFIEITDVRCERVQDITIEDVQAEGIQSLFGKGSIDPTMLARFIGLWNDTNGKDAWERNDWTFAYTFKLIKEHG